MEALKTVKLCGETLRVVRDTDATSPREWDNLGTFYAWSKSYSWGDDHDFEGSGDFLNTITDDDLVVNVYAYIHGSVELSVGAYSCPWDSGQVGYIFITKEKMISEYGENYDIEKIRGYLSNEIVEYNNWQKGNCFGYVIEEDRPCDTCGKLDPEEESSCFGFIGEDWESSGLIGELPLKWQKELAK